MTKALFYPLSLLLLLGCANVSWAVQSTAKSVLISTGSSQAPYYIIKSHAGLITEIIESSCYHANLSCRFIAFSNIEAQDKFKRKEVDATTNALPRLFPDAHLSDKIYAYKNRVFSLTRNQLFISQLNDLQPYSIIAFSAASHLLGSEFNALTLRHGNYQEYQNQRDQVQALFTGAADTIIADELIFAYLRSRLIHKQGLHSIYRQPVTLHKIFPESDYRLAFHDPMLQRSFNKGLQIIKDNGKFDSIVNKYQSLLHRYLK